ncbi:MAG TPA: AAA family ATPase [Candidatus Binatia bacterium]|nr:AAA family ATPase [Candidatus Binatia bacterium]
MQREGQVTFRHFRFDPTGERLWRGARAIALRPKTFAVLRLLVERAGQLVTKEELLDAVWPDTSVSDVVPIVCVRELRQALGDQADAPHFIETVPRRGYRFIAPLSTAPPEVSRQLSGISKRKSAASSQLATGNRPLTTPLIGREAELARLHEWLEKAASGERQIGFVWGEVGIGKTAVVEAFLARASVVQQWWIGRGQCLEHYGAGEAYMPVLDALGRLCRGPGGKRLIEILTRLAPTWLAQMPSLVSAADLEVLQRQILGATRERMLREMAEAVEGLTSERPLVLVLEDLHWSDHSTLDLVSYLARRQEPARLLLIGTYRPAEPHLNQQPLKAIKRELQMHKRCEELPLELLPEAVVGEYLAQRFRTPNNTAYEPQSEILGARLRGHDEALSFPRKPVLSPSTTLRINFVEGRESSLSAVSLSVETPQTASLQKLAQLIHQRTDGNPLFVVNVVDYLLTQGVITTDGGQWELTVNLEETGIGVPASLRQMIEKQIDGLTAEEQRVLEAASVAGVEFSAAAVAAGLRQEVAQGEERCAELARGEQFLRACGVDEWPDGTVAGRYKFIHILYQNVLYQRLTEGQRLHLHRRIGERKETGYGKRVGEVAGELAIHFTQGRDYWRAVQYLQQAAQNAIHRYAFREALGPFTKGLELLRNWPDTPERTQQELLLHMTVIWPLMAAKGEAAPEVERAYAQIWELYQQLGETEPPFWVVFGRWVVHLVRGEIQTALELDERLMGLAQKGTDPTLLRWAHHALGVSLFWAGELTAARAHLEQAVALHDAQQHPHYILNPKIVCLSYAAQVLWFLGYPDQAVKQSPDALALAQQASHPYGLVLALGNAAGVHIGRREGRAAQERAEAMIALAQEQGFPQYVALGTLIRGEALAEQGQREEGIRQMQQGLAASKATGAELGLPAWLVLLAAAHGQVGQAEEGLTLLAEAEAAMGHKGERVYEAELYRVKGELLLNAERIVNGKVRPKRNDEFKKTLASVDGHRSSVIIHRSAEAEAEACFHQARAIARRQSAKSLELRAAMSLGRLWQQQGRKAEARRMLAEIYGWFTEGFDTPDLQEARALLEE